jgi:hypothetical protein
MITFIFMLTPETERLLAERVQAELYAQFPEHHFEAGQADIPEFENTILPLHGTEDEEEPGKSAIPDGDEVQRVKDAFETILDKMTGSEPS